MSKVIAGFAMFVLAVAAGCSTSPGPGSTAGARAAAIHEATTAPPATPTTAAPVPTTTTTGAVSSCEQTREALLTGSQAQINTAMSRLIADTSADGTAREYADYYLHRDAPPAYGSKDLRGMDISLIRMSCR